MSQFRFAALLTLLAVAGCYRYSDASQQSTMAEPQYMSGPPGGAMDPDYGYGQSTGGPVAAVGPGAPTGPAVAGDADDDEDTDVDQDADDDAAALSPPAQADAAQDPSDDPSVAVGPGMQGPDGAGEPGAEAPQANDGSATGPVVAAAPTGTVSNGEIDATLDGYGQWVETDDYGAVWRPDATVVGVDFTPYESGGSWVYSDAGWAFSCDYPWGWLPFHYGRWAWFHDYWGWVPGHRWGPAWVDWRHGNGVVGWRPRPPRLPDHRPSTGHHGRGVLVRDHRHAEQHDAHWRFATARDFSRPHVRSHLYGNLAEGLRVTSRVGAPPLRARATVHAADLMRNRFAAGRSFQPGRPGQPGRAFQPGQPGRTFQPGQPGRAFQPGQPGQPGPGRFGGPAQVRDHRGADPGRSFQPPAAPPAQAVRPLPRNQQPYGAYRPPVYRPPASSQPGQPPMRTYQPPMRTYQPPMRTYQPPARTYQPSAPPPRVWSPPAHSASPPVHSSSPSGGAHFGGGGSPGPHSGASSSGGSHPSSSGGSHPSSSGGSHPSSSSSSHSSGHRR